MEANVIRYAEFLKRHGNIEDWEYEPDEYFFPVKRGPGGFYKPDIKIWLNRAEGRFEYWEVKGFMSPTSKTKLKRMTKYYPCIRVELIDTKRYQEIKKWAKLIPGWE